MNDSKHQDQVDIAPRVPCLYASSQRFDHNGFHLSLDPRPLPDAQPLTKPIEDNLSSDKEKTTTSSIVKDMDNLVCVKHGVVPMVMRNSSKIGQLFGVQLVSIGTRTDLKSGCDYVVFRMDSFQSLEQSVAQSVQVNTYLY